MVAVAEGNCMSLWGCGDEGFFVCHRQAVCAAMRVVFGHVPVFSYGKGFGHCLSESVWPMCDDDEILFIRTHWLVVECGLYRAEKCP